MDKIESYLLLFTDSLVGNLAINPKKEFIVHTMNFLGCYDKKYILLITILATIISTLVNYLIGKLLLKLSIPYLTADSQKRNKPVLELLLKYDTIILMLVFLPNYGKFIQVFAVFFGSSFKKILFISMLSKLIYYTVLVY
ncbi:MAG: hypothetical protein EOP33_01500 [Rickettsiaceae bacterium]|nr:MAG: hypothetical protein EOP33_01500 [Rickettsiaceae bacterium]